jgi:hypothetical protein
MDQCALDQFLVNLGSLHHATINRKKYCDLLLTLGLRLSANANDDLWCELTRDIPCPSYIEALKWLGLDGRVPLMKHGEESHVSGIEASDAVEVGNPLRVGNQGDLYTEGAQLTQESFIIRSGDDHTERSVAPNMSLLGTTLSRPSDLESPKEYRPLAGIYTPDASQVVHTLQANRAALAFAFRRLVGSKGTSRDNAVRIRDLADALSLDPLNIHIESDAAWRLVCDMARVPYTSNQLCASVMFSDVMRYLDDQQTGGEPKHKDQLVLAFIKRKLHDSQYVSGDRLKLLALAPRFRIHKRRMSSTHSSDTSDFCSVHELQLLLETADISLSRDDAAFLCKESQVHSGETVFAEKGAEIGTVLLFLSHLL